MTCAEAVGATLWRLTDTGPANDVQVWAVDLEGAVDCDSLSLVERARAASMREPHRRRWVTSAAATRCILAGYLGVEPGDLVVDRTCHGCGRPHGRARLAGTHAGALRWSMSRSAGTALLAVSEGRRVGIDIERLRVVPAATGVATRFLAPSEADAVLRAPEEWRSEVLLRLWTRKEAFLKATGLGLSRGLRWFRVDGPAATATPTPIEVPAARGSHRWWMGDLRVGGGVVAALVAST